MYLGAKRRYINTLPFLSFSLGSPEPTTETASRSVQAVLHNSRNGVRTPDNGPPLIPLKIAPLHGGSGPTSSTWFPELPEPTFQMASPSVQPVFCKTLSISTVRHVRHD